MLLKIEKVAEIGRFAELKHRAPEFGNLTLVFARNGYGKSTLCSVLRSANEQDPNLIKARRRLGATGDSLVHTKWQTPGDVKFQAGAWDKCTGPVFIFDSEYVHRNLHIAESVTRENKRQLLTVIFGETGVGLAKKVSDLDAEQRILATEQQTREKLIKTVCTGVTDVAAFAKASIPEDLDARLVAAAKNVELARNAMAVRDRPTLLSVVVPSVAAIKSLLSRDVANITENAAEQVQSHIAAHQMFPNGERWLRYGIDHLSGDICPFCTQDTREVGIVQAFKGFFSAAYAELSGELDAALVTLKDFVKPGAGFTQAIIYNQSELSFWKTVCDVEIPSGITIEFQRRVLSAVQALIQALEHKIANPLSKGAPIDEAAIESGLRELQAYVDAVLLCQPAIDEARSNATSADLPRAQDVHNKLKALQSRQSGQIKDEIAQWLTRDQRKAEIEQEKKQAQIALKNYVERTTMEKQNAINELLELFGASFKIANTKASFVGREANTDYAIQIGSHIVPAGERSGTQPSFNTVLSAGDKFTFALAFFITQVKSDPDLSKATIVFDDPFSSLDAQREFETTSQLRALAQSACQVIVFSHDPRFLALIEKNARSPVLTYQINCDDTGEGEIRTWSSVDELKDIYVRQGERIREYASTGQFLPGATAESLIKDIRPFCEDYLRARYPGRFGPLVMLEAMARQIEAAGTADPLFPKVADFIALNEYTRDNMHAGATAPNPIALRTQCRRIISVIGAF